MFERESLRVGCSGGKTYRVTRMRGEDRDEIVWTVQKDFTLVEIIEPYKVPFALKVEFLKTETGRAFFARAKVV